LKEERQVLLEKWLEIDAKSKKEIALLMPKRVKRRQQLGET
jgi:hypothetical protein